MTDTRRPQTRKADPLAPLLRRYLDTADQEAVEELHRRTRPRLLAAARRIGASQDAEDAVQSAYLALVARGEAVLAAPVEAWLLTAVVRIAYRRKAVDQRQDAIAKRLAIPRDGVAFVDEGLASEDAALVRRHVRNLPPTYRDPVVLHYLEGLDTQETSDLLGVTPGALRVRLHRARRLLRAGLAAPFLAILLAGPWWTADVVRQLLRRPGFAVPGGAVATSLWGTMMLAVVLAAGGTLMALGGVPSSWAESWFGAGRGSRSSSSAGASGSENASLRDAARTARRGQRQRGAATGEKEDAGSERVGVPGETEVQELYYVSGPLRARHEMLWRSGGEIVKHGGTETFYVNGRKESVGGYEADLREGPWTEWFENGGKLSEGAYRRGEKEGDWTYYHEPRKDVAAGTQHESGAYVAGRRHGEWTIRFRNGAVQYEGEYENGLKQGEWVERYADGAVMQKGPFVEGTRSGVWKAWNGDGTLAWEAAFDDDDLHGTHTQHERDGRRIVTEYVRGELHGSQATYYATGEKERLTEFVGGKRHGRAVGWHRNGRKQSEFAYERGALHGAAKTWYPDGTPSGSWTYERAKPVGTSTTWYPSGRKRTETVFGENERSESTSWYRDGSLRESGARVVGKRTGTWQVRLKDGTRHECTYGRSGQVVSGTLVWFRPRMLEESASGVRTWELVPYRLRTYRDGRYHGPAVDFHPEGITRRAAWNNVDGVAEGMVTRWDAEGNVTATELWRGGEKVEEPVDAAEE